MANFFAQSGERFSPEGGLEHVLENDRAGGGRLFQVLLIAAIAASGLSMLFSIGTAVLSARGGDAGSGLTGHVQTTDSTGIG
jgi:hypothetical protein